MESKLIFELYYTSKSIFIFKTAITENPVLSGGSPQCSPSLSSLQDTCIKNAEHGAWNDSIHVNFKKFNVNDEAMNGLQVECVREFTGMDKQMSLTDAKKACASTSIEYAGVSETIMSLYDHVEYQDTQEIYETGKHIISDSVISRFDNILCLKL